jgi:hypothetical protein
MGSRNRLYKSRHPRFSGQESGLWNEAKSKTLLILYWRYQNGETDSIGLQDLQELTGVGYRTLATGLPKWNRWRYIRRRLIVKESSLYKHKSRSVYGYAIATKGIRWIEEWARHYLPVRRYRDEIMRWQDFQRAKQEQKSQLDSTKSIHKISCFG